MSARITTFVNQVEVGLNSGTAIAPARVRFDPNAITVDIETTSGVLSFQFAIVEGTLELIERRMKADGVNMTTRELHNFCLRD